MIPSHVRAAYAADFSEWPEDREFTRTVLVDGVEKPVHFAEVDGQVYEISDGPVTTARLEGEWFEDIEDHLSALCCPGDLLTFWQRPPNRELRHSCYHELESVAFLPLSTYESWWKSQIDAKTRNMVRRAEKAGVTVRECGFDDDFVRGMVAIFNESPVRQGRKFWHYGKDFETVKRQFARHLHRETMLRADLGGEMVGFVMLGWSDAYGVVGQILSSFKHRDKAVNNALMAKAVEICADRGKSLVYGFWDSESSLTAFKRSNGFAEMTLPRYFVPLTWRGRVALRLKAHRGIKHMLPAGLKRKLKELRARLL